MEEIILRLNQNTDGAVYVLNGNQLTGTWRQDLAANGALSASSQSLDYIITITLNPGKTYSYQEKLGKDTSATGAAVSGGGVSFGKTFDKSMFSGKTLGMKKTGFTHHFGGQSGSNQYSYNLENDKIKQPLLKALQAAGYQEQRKSLIGKLFGR